MRVEFSPPDITEAEIEAVAEALRSGWITTGPRTKRLEQQLAAWCQTPRVVCLNSATAALECALRLLGIGPGDEVITSAYTYTASASVICHVGATPVLIDTAPGSYQMDYEALAAAITPRTKAVIPVDIAGVMCDYDTLQAVLRRESVKARYAPAAATLQATFDHVPVLADGAHSFGATRQGRPSGSVADFTAFSFHAVKNLTTAEGGALTWRARPEVAGWDDEALYRQMMLLSLHGQSRDALSKNKPGAWEYDIVAPYYKCNMTDLAAALGLAQLERIPALLARRRALLERYAKGLGDSGLRLDVLAHYSACASSSGHLCMVRLIGRSEAFRNRFIERMAARQIACNVHYKPLPLLTAYRDLGFDIRDFPNALAQYQCEVTLPVHTRLTDEALDYVIAAFCEAYEECAQADAQAGEQADAQAGEQVADANELPADV
ncbi:MAG: DegT/DnrJ/EryC1/StrS family aminotransferase [Coriobacteriales bacterium]|jgi:dTDP-4-amino-4,6-dideoxygalactose transaminase|nr:DegT/DnrJ/EryC1/StrS family aminotransferase [Coriobacteriales bacterium]